MRSKRNKRDYYDILGVNKNQSSAEIKKAYRTLAMKYHPDRNHAPDAEAKFKEIQEAYSILGDDDKRATFDQYGFESPMFEGFQGGGFSGFGDIFDMFFGGSGGRGRGRRPRRRQQYGEDIERRVNISLKDVLKGIKKEIQFERYIPCSSCDGTGGTSITCDKCHGNGQVEQVTQSLFGRVMQVTTCPKCRGEGKMITNKCTECNGKKVVPETKTISPNIPAGVETGQMLKLQGMGHIPSKNAVPGDLLIVIIVKPNKNFERDGTSILSTISISFLQAIKGSKVNVKTIDGNVKMKIPPGTQSGAVVKLREKGLPRLNRPKFRGIHYLTVEVENPKYNSLPTRAKEIIDELSTLILPVNEVDSSNSKKSTGKRRKR